MANLTQQTYRNTFSGSVVAGMGSLFKPNGRRYYVLEHKVSSKYHKAGESQEIIVDNIELGRDTHCQVRFDDSFATVSRRHAAIVRHGDGWKLIQISRTNSTLLNGHPIQNEWYLQNGDEIQLSLNGPKLGFIVPTGDKATVGSIGMTRRLSLFRQQALAPYKHAIWALSCILVLSIIGLTTWNILQKKSFDAQIADARNRIKELIASGDSLQILMQESEKEQARLDSVLKAYGKRGGTKVVHHYGTTQGRAFTPYEEDVFFLSTIKVVVTDGEEEVVMRTPKGNNYGWIGTGFLLDDGRFVTAKHCVESWKFFNSLEQLQANLSMDEESLELFLYALGPNPLSVVSYIKAESQTKTLYFKSTDFVMNKTTESQYSLGGDFTIVHSPINDGTDWAYVPAGVTKAKGRIHADSDLASNLDGGQDLTVLGFPFGKGALDASKFGPLYGSCKSARKGLNHGLIEVSSRSFESGNSGGPVFAVKGGKVNVVGIVSYELRGTSLGGLVPISNLR